MNFRFKKPVYFGDTITCFFTITDIDACNRAKAEAVFRNQNGQVVLQASLRGMIPGPEEKRVMSLMMAEGDPTNKSGGETSCPENEKRSQ